MVSKCIIDAEFNESRRETHTQLGLESSHILRRCRIWRFLCK
jgi:hypothetical protein